MEELVDELYFEIGQIETSVVVAIVLVSKVEDDLIFFIFVLRIQEFVNQSIGQVLHLAMAGDESIKFELNLGALIQVCDAL